MNTNSVFEGAPAGTSDRAAKLLEAAWSAMEANELREVSQSELCRHLGIVPGTLINWTTKATELHQIEAMMRLLERLPDGTRRGLLERFLRLHPTIESSRFAQEPGTVSRLRTLVRQSDGLTFIMGGTDDARTFVITALGHSFQRLYNREGAISGIDVHATDWFVPVFGVAYMAFAAERSKLLDKIMGAWPRPDHAAALLLNGVWSLLPEKQKEILGWSAHHHVFVADELNCTPRQRRTIFRELKAPVRFLNVTETDQECIHLDFQTL